MKLIQNKGVSFYRKIKVSLGLMGVLPFMLTLYLFSTETHAPSILMFLSSALVLFSMLVGFNLLRKSSDQMSNLVAKTAIPESGVLEELEDLNVDGELKDIASNFNSIVEQLNQAKRDLQSRSYQLQEFAGNLSESYEHLENENKLRNQLCRYVGKDLVEKLVTAEDSLLLKNERKAVTVMFADIRSFTALSEYMEPEDVVSMLNEYFSIMTDILFKYDGMLDKFVGDQIMAVFGHRSSERDGARSAVRAAMEMQKATVALMKKRADNGLRIFQVGIGINTGSAILASVGATNRQDYTVIGDTVNTTAKLEKYALGREIVIGERTRNHLPAKMNLSVRQELRMKNRSTPLVCYKVRPTRKKVMQTAAARQSFRPAISSAVAC